MSDRRVVLVTGASSGIGRACACHLHARGYRVYGTSRRAEPARSVPPPDRSEPCQCMIPMDVTDEASVRRGVETILAREGRIDVVVNNAGMGIAGAVEDTTLAEAQAQFDTNFFGMLRVCRAVLPHMRCRLAGRDGRAGGYIVNLSSIGGLIGMPFQALYSASKHAVEGLTESLRLEVRPYGIRVVLVEPGDFRTGFTERRRMVAAAAESAYRDPCRRSLDVMEHDETHGAAPERAARLVERIITTRSPRLRYVVGPVSEQVAITAKKVLPYSLFEWIVMKYYRLG